MTDYEVPKWAGKPATGIHLDVMKEGKLVQKIMVDEKKCYFFGRNPTLNDVLVDHQSCSRVHAALIYHKVLERNFLVDLGSKSRIPTQLPIDSSFHFGASTRIFTLRDKPINKRDGNELTDDGVDIVTGHLPEDEIELDNLTEYNTLNNKRITTIGIADIDNDSITSQFRSQNVKRKRDSVRFKEEEDIINPEDIDPSVGKFRNLVQTEIVSTTNKKRKSDHGTTSSSRTFNILRPDHDTFDPATMATTSFNPLMSNSLSIKLGIHLPNPAPMVEDNDADGGNDASGHGGDLYSDIGMSTESSESSSAASAAAESERKKKYAKEAWPGRKAGLF